MPSQRIRWQGWLNTHCEWGCGERTTAATAIENPTETYKLYQLLLGWWSGRRPRPEDRPPTEEGFEMATTARIATIIHRALSGAAHPHRPWQLSRWTLDHGRDGVMWELLTAPCPQCPDCRGTGGCWIGGGPFGDDPEYDMCARCAAPLVSVRVPTRLDRLLPGSPARPATALADEAPF